MPKIIRDIYFRLSAAVYVAANGKEKDPHPQRLILKILDNEDEKYLGIYLDSLHVVDDLIEILERVRGEMDEPSKVDPRLKTLKSDKKH